MRPVLIALAAAAVAATASLACGQDEEAVPTDATPAPTLTPVPASAAPAVKGQLWRWVNVTVAIPGGSDVYVVQTSYGPEVNPPDGGPVLELVKDVGGNTEFSSSLLIDAVSGSVIRDNVRDEHRAEIEAILKTLTVQPLDISTASWPIASEIPVDARRESFEGISFIRPTHDTGIEVYYGIGDYFGSGGPAPSIPFVGIKNGRSVGLVSLNTETGGLVTDVTHVVPQDRAAFDRWLASVKLCTTEVQC